MDCQDLHVNIRESTANQMARNRLRKEKEKKEGKKGGGGENIVPQLLWWAAVYNLYPQMSGTIGMHVLLDAVNAGVREQLRFHSHPIPSFRSCFSCSSSVPTVTLGQR